MGLLSLAGVGRGMADVADQNTKRWAEEDLTRLREEMEEKKMMAVQRIAQQARAEQGQRLSTAQQGLLNQATEDNARTFYGSDPAPKIDSMIDEEKQQFAPSDRQRMDALIQAGLQTGTIDPAHAAESMRKTEADAWKSAYQTSEQQRRKDQRDRDLDLKEMAIRSRSGNSLGQAKFDEQMISKHVKENADFYTYTPLGQDKAVTNELWKSGYTRLLRALGPDKADQVMRAAQEEAKQSAIGKDGVVDDVKFKQAFDAKMNVFISELTGNGKKQEPAKSASQPKPTTEMKRDRGLLNMPEEADYSSDNLPEGMKKTTSGNATVYTVDGGGTYYDFQSALNAWKKRANQQVVNRNFANNPITPEISSDYL